MVRPSFVRCFQPCHVCICHASGSSDAFTLPPRITRRLSHATRYNNNGNKPYNGTQVDSMCSYQICRDAGGGSSNSALDAMCKLAENNVYWQGLSMEEQAKGFQSFREEVLRKAQSAFLYRQVLDQFHRR